MESFEIGSTSDNDVRSDSDRTSFFPEKRKASSLFSRFTTKGLIYFAVAFLLLIVTVALFLKEENLTKPSMGAADDEKPHVCIHCSILRPAASKEGKQLYERLDKSVSKGQSSCCAQGYDEVSDLLDFLLRRRQLMQENFNKSATDGISEFIFTPVSAHKRLLESKTIYDVYGATYYTLRLNSTFIDPRTEHVRGVQIRSDGLFIIHPGLYFVYSSIAFRSKLPLKCKTADNTMGFLSCVVRSHASRFTPDVLLRSEHGCCNDCIMNIESGYTGGIFFLAKNDVIHSEISVEGHGLFTADTSFIGLIMLGTGTAKTNPQKFMMSAK